MSWNRIGDKKRWWAANFCTTYTPVSPNRFFGLGLGLGLVGIMAILVLGIIMAGSLAPAAGISTYALGNVLISDSLKMERAAKAESAQVIYTKAKTENRTVTPEEKTSFDALMAEVDGLTPRIESQIKIEAAIKDGPNPLPSSTRPSPAADKKPFLESVRMRFAVPKAFVAKAFGGSQAIAEEAAYRSGMWLAARFGMQDNPLTARAREYCKEHGVFSAGMEKERVMFFDVHEEGVNTTGGTLVPAEMENAIIDLREQYGAFRRLAKIVPMGSDYKTQPRRTGGLTAYPLGESAAFTESTKNWDNISLTAKLWGVLAKYSTSLGEDSVISVADDLAQESAYAFAIAEDDAGFNGTGSSAYHGIVGVLPKITTFVDSSGSGAVNAASGHDTFAEIDGDDIDILVGSLPQYADPNAVFVISKMGKALVFDPLLRAGGGNNKSDIAGRMLNAYLGYPIEIAQKMPSVTSALNNLPMFLYGDFKAAVSLGVRRGIMVQQLNELFATNGQIGIIASERFDINVHDVGSSSAVGPIVAMMGNT